MKKPTLSILNLLALSALLAVAAPGASFAGTESCEKNEWASVKKAAVECLELREAGKACESIVYPTSRTAAIRLDGHSYSAELMDSEFADGGDLSDLVIERDDGCRYELRSVPAYGDVLVALTSI